MQEECMNQFPELPQLRGWQEPWPNWYLKLLVYFLKKGTCSKWGGDNRVKCQYSQESRCIGTPPFLPNLIYKPKITFERARLQQGYFIYQPYIETSNGTTLLQEIGQFKVIEVKNTESILKELDNIGINYGTLYGDFDSYAKYYRKKYYPESK